MSNKFETIISRSYQLAVNRHQELVTLEHLLAALLEDKDLQHLINNVHGDLDSLTKNNLAWLDNADNHVIVKAAQYQPRHTTLLSNIVKKAKTQSMFSGKQEVMPIDLFIAMYGIEDSPASYFLDKFTPGKDAIIEYLSKTNNISDGETLDPKEAEEVLRAFCINLNERAINGKIDPLIGREREVEYITQILARRNKHNIIMTGSAGVGKTVIVEGLAKRIVEKDVPDTLLDKTIWSIDIASMVAGTRYRGDFEERMKQVIRAFQSSPNTIAFIDEIHMIMGAGNGGGGALDAANMLKPALSRGEIRCIGSTTLEEYRKHFEKDRALIRRFQRVDIFEPSIEDSKRILHGIAKYYENYHKVTYETSALDAAVELTSKYIHDKFLPDKAIDIIDSAAAWQRIRPEELRLKTITKIEIESEVGRTAKIPVSTVKTDDTQKLERLEDNLKKVVFGQDEALESLVNAVYMSRAGLRENDKTLGSYLFTGPTGVGKTEAAKQLAETLGIAFVRLDMSEFQERHTVSRLIGSPPGYVGYGDGGAGNGILINALDVNPHCVLLLDEIEKAHPDVFNILLQIMDHGVITSSQGKEASARQVLLICTSNAGAADLERESIGFHKNERDDDTKAINSFFSPEFRNRLDAIIKFNKLTKDNMYKVLNKFIKELNDLSAKRKVNIVINPDAKDWLITKGFDDKMGARPLGRIITENIKKPLSKEILFGKLKHGGAVMISIKDNKLDFQYMTPAEDIQSNLEINGNNQMPQGVTV